MKPLHYALLAICICGTAASAVAQTPAAPGDSGAPPAMTPTVTASGLSYLSLHEGTGGVPVATDTVRVHYRGTLANGQEFDSSYKRGQPAEFPLNRVIACWTEGVQRMHIGGRARLTCPPNLAYGASGAGNGLIPPNATLTFEIELLGIISR